MACSRLIRLTPGLNKKRFYIKSGSQTLPPWTASIVADYSRRMAYPTIFEVEPNVIFYQSGKCLEL